MSTDTRKVRTVDHWIFQPIQYFLVNGMAGHKATLIDVDRSGLLVDDGGANYGFVPWHTIQIITGPKEYTLPRPGSG